MRSFEQVATECLKCAVGVHPNTIVVGDVTAIELARLAVLHITSCPECGAEPFVNIDCELCAIGERLEAFDD